MENISVLKQLFSRASKVSVVVHTHPDGDALGSGAALVTYLSQRLGKDAMLIIPDSAPDTISFITEGMDVLDASLLPEEAAERISQSDLLVILDLNELHRTEQLAPIISSSSARKILVDHHLRPQLDGFFLATNNFANSVIPSTLQMAAELLQAGVDRDGIIDKLYHSDRQQRLMAFADMVANHLTILPSGISYMIMTSEMQDAYGTDAGETEGLVNVPLTMQKVRMSIFLREEGGLFRVSIRSKRGLSARNMAAEYFHGGGHELAAGGKIFWPQDIPSKEAASSYLEEIAARFLRNETTN